MPMTALLRVSVYVTTFWCVLADWKADNCSGDRIHFGTTLKFGLPPYNYQIQFDHDQSFSMCSLGSTSQKASYVDSRYSTFYNVGRDVIFVSSDSHSGVLTRMPVAKVSHFAWCYSQGPMTIKMQEEIQTTPFTVMQDFTFF